MSIMSCVAHRARSSSGGDVLDLLQREAACSAASSGSRLPSCRRGTCAVARPAFVVKAASVGIIIGGAREVEARE